MNEQLDWLAGQVGALVVAGVWAAVAAVRRRITRSRKVRGILAAHLPSVCSEPMSDEQRKHELSLRCNLSLTNQGEPPLSLDELEEVRSALKRPRAATESR